MKWLGSGGFAYVSYEVEGLPNSSTFKVAAYGYSTGFRAAFVDPYLGVGGLALDSSDFVDIHFSTAGLASITRATLSILGRSFNTTTSGSFNWQTFHGTGSTPTDFVSNAAPYAWYSADVTSTIKPEETGGLLRIKAGALSNALVVSEIELCLEAN